MNHLLGTEDPRYSLKTLRALYYGATHGGAGGHGVIHITFTDDKTGNICAGNVLSVGTSSIFARTDDGALKLNVKPALILHAEVI